MTHPVPARPPRRFSSDDILQGRVNLDGYPLRYVYVQPSQAGVSAAVFSFGTRIPDEVDRVMSAVEFLETRGWELVNFEQGGLLAFLRRRPYAWTGRAG